MRLRHLLPALALTASAVGFTAASVNAAVVVEVTPQGGCLLAEETGSAGFYITGGIGLNYHLEVEFAGGGYSEDGTITTSPQTVSYDSVPLDVVVSATININSADHTFGPTVLFIDGDTCEQRAPEHGLDVEYSFSCDPGAPFLLIAVENTGDYEEEVDVHIGAENLNSSVLPGDTEDFDGLVTAGSTVAVTVVAGATTYFDEDIAVPSDVCGDESDTPGDDDGEGGSGGNLPDSGSSSTILMLLAGALLAVGIALRSGVRMFARR